MSNPQINRWGSNLIWYNFWYSDRIYDKQVQQDRIFAQLLETYLTYGLESYSNRFGNLYWYKNSRLLILPSSYYRYATIRRPIVKIATVLRLRSSVKDQYRMRVWILRYSNWLVINMYWFHPNKNKKRKVTQLVRQKLAYDYISTDNILHPTTYRRFIALKNFTHFKTLSDTLEANYYTF